MLCLQCERLKKALHDLVEGYHFVDKDMATVIRTRANAVAQARMLLEELDRGS